MSSWQDSLDHNGYALLSDLCAADVIEEARQALDALLANEAARESIVAGKDGPASGLRNLLRLWPGVVELVRQSPLSAAIEQVLGPNAGLVRGLYFDKPPGHSWALPWHRDLTIAVARHGVIGQFKRPTVKAGVPHVEAPRAILAGMLSARIHLDAMSDANGPLRVQPRSHVDDAPKTEPVVIHCAAGDVLLMRPLLSHSSAVGEEGHPGHRRVIHLEFAPSTELPDDYRWHDFVTIREPAE